MQRARRILLTALVATMLVVIVVAVLSSIAGTDEPRDIGAGVIIADADLGEDLKATAVSDVAVPINMVYPVSSVFRIEPQSELGQTATVTLPLSTTVPKNQETVVFTADSLDGPWTPVPTEVLAGGESVAAEVTRLSFLTVLWLNVPQIQSSLNENARNRLEWSSILDVDLPQCENEAGALGGGFSVTATSQHDTLRWCVGLRGDSRVLTIASNRRYPLILQHPGLLVTERTMGDAWAGFTDETAERSSLILLPGEQVTFELKSPVESGGVTAELTSVSSSLISLFVVAEAFSDTIEDMGLTDNTPPVDLAGNLSDNEACSAAVFNDLVDIQEVCLTPDNVRRALSMWGVVFGPAMPTDAGARPQPFGPLTVDAHQDGGDQFDILLEPQGERPLPEFCGSVTDRTRRGEYRVTITEGRVSCAEALQIADDYSNGRADSGGSSGVSSVKNWQCYVGGCENFDKRFTLEEL